MCILDLGLDPPARIKRQDSLARLKRVQYTTGHLDLGGIAAGGDPSSQLMAYKNPGGTTNATTTTVTGDYIDLNELLNLEGGGHEEDNSILI